MKGRSSVEIRESRGEPDVLYPLSVSPSPWPLVSWPHMEHMLAATFPLSGLPIAITPSPIGASFSISLPTPRCICIAYTTLQYCTRKSVARMISYNSHPSRSCGSLVALLELSETLELLLFASCAMAKQGSPMAGSVRSLAFNERSCAGVSNG